MNNKFWKKNETSDASGFRMGGLPQQKSVPPMPEVKPPKVKAEYKPETRFHAFCAGCDEMEPIVDYVKYMAGGQLVMLNTLMSCKQYDKCKAMAEKIEDRLRG